MTNQLTTLLLPSRKFLEKHHIVLFITFVALLPMVCIYFLYAAADQTPPETESTTSAISKFDESTIGRIKNLHDSTDSSQTLEYPSGRTNPFTE